MAVNADKPHLWKADVAKSVDFYNDWFMRFAPVAYRNARLETTKQVEAALIVTQNLTRMAAHVIRENPSVLPILRMATAPPLARDRLAGLSGVPRTLVQTIEEEGRIPPRMPDAVIEENLGKMARTLAALVDVDIFPWLDCIGKPSEEDIYRAATIVADRLCGSIANPIIRNAQEKRQLGALGQWLKGRGYRFVGPGEGSGFTAMEPGTFSFRVNVRAKLDDELREVNVPVDAVVMRKRSSLGNLPLLIEAKSAGDFTNTNKRRKEEATKIGQLRRSYGKDICFILFLCGYFDGGYLGYEAAEGIDWVWEHRVSDLRKFGV